MIDINHLSFGYSSRRMLYNDLTLTLKAGSIYGLLGKNGAGKSTLLKNIAGLLRPTGGQIRVFGELPYRRRPAFLQKIYIIPEEVYTPAISINRYLTLFSPFYPGFSMEDFNRYMSIFEVDPAAHLKRLSLGQRKKFIIAFAVACNTDLLILDEPTNGLDIPSKTQFRKLISGAMNDSRIVIISTHQTRDLENLIDSVLVVNEGQLLLSAGMQEVGSRLLFEVVPDPAYIDNVLFSEYTIGGYGVVRANTEGLETRVNLEYLFHAVTEKPKEIAQLFYNRPTV